MITSVLQLSARPGNEQAVDDLYADLGVLDRSRAFPGCRGAVLLRTVEGALAAGGATHVVIAEWDDEAAYAAWVADPWRNDVGAALAPLLDAGAAPRAGAVLAPVT
ncbi:Quinol monooxygenase YgiN [Quadrisphaera granulorum]|uniref:Quinol monooxygenase YgiN n=1 Tax=Quadrisphaera granulorum TaxID=317664 RepID=A0A315ZVL7_9ACTN|nr:antibiotic biosynthesis monooxygenase family protein [Quadrisphaera granulorum]PWJ49555.1 quinol monooxygenase YgiN [Quadrisphaera granulorum]SZE98134.1 Quinol monooxygenase YgiN [Quadrisphaera granulorum]